MLTNPSFLIFIFAWLALWIRLVTTQNQSELEMKKQTKSRFQLNILLYTYTSGTKVKVQFGVVLDCIVSGVWTFVNVGRLQ